MPEAPQGTIRSRPRPSYRGGASGIAARRKPDDLSTAGLRTVVAPVRTVVAPVRTVVAPVRTVVAPVRTVVARNGVVPRTLVALSK